MHQYLAILFGITFCAAALGCSIPCSRIFQPVCDHREHSFSNECLARQHSCKIKQAVTIIFHGPCQKIEGCKIPCPRILAPVCGSDGKKYSNECLLRVAACKTREAISLVRTNAADDDCSKCDFLCTKEYKPVCASNGVTYPNECFMRSMACNGGIAINKIYDGTCI